MLDPNVEQSRLPRRALRRHHRQRMIACAKRSVVFSGMGELAKDYFAVRQHDHLKSCSCWMCGNPRKWDGEPTVQEIRRELKNPRRASGGPSEEWN
jgi:hypothetical protein